MNLSLTFPLLNKIKKIKIDLCTLIQNFKLYTRLKLVPSCSFVTTIAAAASIYV